MDEILDGQKADCINQKIISLNVESWEIASPKHVYDFINTNKMKSGSVLVIRASLAPLDMYCYLKARFGEPNGFQTLLKNDTSDNWIHWDYLIIAENNYISICGTAREIHILMPDNLSDQDWHKLIDSIKKDFGRVGKEKSNILGTLEKWSIFPNRYIQIANTCAELHGSILDHIDSFEPYKSFPNKIEDMNKKLEKMQKRMGDLYSSCIKLSLMTPIMAEAFINMAILILCKKSIKKNRRAFDGFIRSQIDVKIFDMFHKCEKFEKEIDPKSKVFKNFKSIMDKRNNRIHGNIDPVSETIETVYFDGRCPLFQKSGDNIGELYASLEKLHDPKTVLSDYENTHMFLLEIVKCISVDMRDFFWQIINDPYPGYDSKRLMAGKLFPEHVFVGILQGMRYDDELEERAKSD